MWQISLLRKAFIKNARASLIEMCKIDNVVWQQDMVSKKNEMEILRSSKKAMIGAMCRGKLIERRSSQFLDLLSLEETLESLAKVGGSYSADMC